MGHSIDKPAKGLEFLHQRILDPEDHTKPARCVVTTVRQGLVYYRFSNHGGGRECCTVDRWPVIAAPIPETAQPIIHQ